MDRVSTLDEYYSAESPEVWARVLGENMHYHHGFYESGCEGLDEAAQVPVRYFYDFLPDGARVLDAGCGWGGPARQLMDEKSCAVTGITISKVQRACCEARGIPTLLGDLETMEFPQNNYDAVLMMECLFHIRDKESLFARLRPCAQRLLIQVNCRRELLPMRSKAHEPSDGHLETPEMICRRLERAGWTIESSIDRRELTAPTLQNWSRNLEREFPSGDPPGQLRDLKLVCDNGLSDVDRWVEVNPLMQIVAS